MKSILRLALFALTAPSIAAAQGYNVGGAEDRRTPPNNQAPVTAANTSASNNTANAQVTATPNGTARVTATTQNRERAWWEYAGVTPGGNELAVLRRWARGRRNRPAVAWPGFQMTQQGSRVFLAVTHSPTFSPVNEPGRLIFRVENAVIPLSNNRRALETVAFNTPVTRAFLRTHGRDTELVIELRASLLPTVSQQSGPEGVTFIMLDFPQWTLPAEQTAQSAPRTAAMPNNNNNNGSASNAAASIRPAANESSATTAPTGVDTERPGQVRVQKSSQKMCSPLTIGVAER